MGNKGVYKVKHCHSERSEEPEIKHTVIPSPSPTVRGKLREEPEIKHCHSEHEVRGTGTISELSLANLPDSSLRLRLRSE
jgi:hypothetical protein